MRSFLFPLLLPLTLVVACSSNSSGGTSSSNSSQTAATTCSWPSDLNPPADAGNWSWTVGHYFLSCNDGNDFVGCISDAPDTCPGPNGIPGGTISGCVDQCNADEYVVAAGGPPQESPDGSATFPPTPNLPSTCRFLTANPAGVSYSCCPCE